MCPLSHRLVAIYKFSCARGYLILKCKKLYISLFYGCFNRDYEDDRSRSDRGRDRDSSSNASNSSKASVSSSLSLTTVASSAAAPASNAPKTIVTQNPFSGKY